MYSSAQMVVKYLKYYITASNGKGHGIHSPFVFEFIQQVLNDNRQFYAYQQIENLRQLLLNDQRTIEIQRMGAGSGTAVSSQQTIAAIAQSSHMSAKWGQLMFRMVDYYQPVNIVELGTSLGITGSYLSMANTNASLTTLEETVAVAAIAKANFKKLGIRNSRLIEGYIEQTLSEWLTYERHIDLALINSKHLHKPATHYFRQLLNHTHENSILIFTEIHRSKEMEQAWKEIQSETAVTLSIDLFFIGIVFFRKEFRVKQTISIRF